MQKLKPMLLLALCLQSCMLATLSVEAASSEQSHERLMSIEELLNPAKFTEIFGLFNVELRTITAYREALCDESKVEQMFNQNPSQFQKHCSDLFTELMQQFVVVFGRDMNQFVERTDDEDFDWGSIQDFAQYQQYIFFILPIYEEFIGERDNALEWIKRHLGQGLGVDKDLELFASFRRLFDLYKKGHPYNPAYGEYITLLIQNPYIKKYLDKAALTPAMVLRHYQTNQDIINFLHTIEKEYNWAVMLDPKYATNSGLKVNQI